MTSLTTRAGNTQDDQQTGQLVAAPLSHGSTNPNSNAAGRRRKDDENLVMAWTASEQANAYAWESDQYPTLNAQAPNDTSNIQYGIRQDMSVRRLTPVECCRLQGFPDDWLGGNELPDSPKYAALGDAVAVPVIEWIGRRLLAPSEHL